MRKINFAILTLILFPLGVLAADFDKPTVVQNYPTDHPLPMNSAEYSYIAINKLILSAKDRIDLSPFYINAKDGSKLNKYIIEPLLIKAEDGLIIRIIVDKKLSDMYPESLEMLRGKPNIALFQTEKYNKMNGVDHCKIIVVDGKTFYLGSHNFDWITFELNHELGVIYNHPELAKVISAVFESEWSGKPVTHVAPETGPYHVATSPRIPGILFGEEEFLNLIRSSKNEVRMQAMNISYYDSYMKENWNAFKDAILSAAGRGVKIKIMFSDWEFTKDSMKKSNEFYQGLLKGPLGSQFEVRVVSFPQQKPCVPYSEVNHAKYMVVDGKSVWIGTGNLSKDYFFTSHDYSFIAAEDKNLAAQMNAIFQQMWDSPYARVYKDPVTTPTDITCSGK